MLISEHFMALTSLSLFVAHVLSRTMSYLIKKCVIIYISQVFIEPGISNIAVRY